MQLTNSFVVQAPPHVVWAFILDVNKLAGCLPGVELTDAQSDEEFKGKVKVKVGPISVSYNGVARLKDRDDVHHSVVVTAEGKEASGSGSAVASTLMTVEEQDDGSVVNMVTDLTIHGRVAQFGRGIMQDVSRALVKQMAGCIRAKLEGGGDAATADTSAPAPAQSMDGLSLMGSVVKDRTKRLLGRH